MVVTDMRLNEATKGMSVWGLSLGEDWGSGRWVAAWKSGQCIGRKPRGRSQNQRKKAFQEARRDQLCLIPLRSRVYEVWEMAVHLDNMALMTRDLDKSCLGGVEGPNLTAVGSWEDRRWARDTSWMSPERFPCYREQRSGTVAGKETNVESRESLYTEGNNDEACERGISSSNWEEKRRSIQTGRLVFARSVDAWFQLTGEEKEHRPR